MQNYPRHPHFGPQRDMCTHCWGITVESQQTCDENVASFRLYTDTHAIGFILILVLKNVLLMWNVILMTCTHTSKYESKSACIVERHWMSYSWQWIDRTSLSHRMFLLSVVWYLYNTQVLLSITHTHDIVLSLQVWVTEHLHCLSGIYTLQNY